jgi:hypothetical protein
MIESNIRSTAFYTRSFSSPMTRLAFVRGTVVCQFLPFVAGGVNVRIHPRTSTRPTLDPPNLSFVFSCMLPLPTLSPARSPARPFVHPPPSKIHAYLQRFYPGLPPFLLGFGSMVLYCLAAECDRPSSNILAFGSPNDCDHDSPWCLPNFTPAENPSFRCPVTPLSLSEWHSARPCLMPL